MATKLTELVDRSLLAYFKSKLDLLFANKVDKENGKGLSSNDFTSEEKTKLANIEAGAQVNVLEGVQVNGSTITPVSKIANIPVPVGSDANPAMDGIAAPGTGTAWARGDHVHPTDTSRAPLASPAFTGTPTAPTAVAGTNTTQIATTEFVQTAIGNLGSVLNYKGVKATVADLPATGNKTGDVWHVTADSNEYAWDGSAWEALGETIDLSGYVLESETSLATTAQIDAMFAAQSGGE